LGDVAEVKVVLKVQPEFGGFKKLFLKDTSTSSTSGVETAPERSRKSVAVDFILPWQSSLVPVEV